MSPGTLPEPLHWFKWEAYWTWVSGFALLVLVYYVGAERYLLDASDAVRGRSVYELGAGGGIAAIAAARAGADRR